MKNFFILSVTSVCCSNASKIQVIMQHFIEVSGKYCKREGERIFKEMFILAGKE